MAVYTYPVTPVVPPHAPASPAHSGPASTRSRLASQPGGGSTGSLSSSLASGGPAGRGGGGGLPRRGSKGRLGDDAGGSSRMAQAWAGKHLLIGVVVALLRYELPGMVESFVYGELGGG